MTLVNTFQEEHVLCATNPYFPSNLICFLKSLLTCSCDSTSVWDETLFSVYGVNDNLTVVIFAQTHLL